MTNFTGGVVTASGKIKAVNGDGGITLGENVTAKAGADEASAVPVDAIGTQKWVQVKEITKYPLWVGDTQVTGANASDVFSDGTVSYTPAVEDDTATDEDESAPATLTLNGANITTYHSTTYSGIRYEGSDDLNIVLSPGSVNTIKKDCSIYIAQGIECDHADGPDITILGTGELNIGAQYNGVYTTGNLTIQSGIINADATLDENTGFGFYSDKNITIDGGSGSGDHVLGRYCGSLEYRGSRTGRRTFGAGDAVKIEVVGVQRGTYHLFSPQVRQEFLRV